MAECICFPTPPSLHITHGGAIEPASALEPNPECPEHFRKPPHRLANGDWSDGVDRSKRIRFRYITSRWEITVASDGAAFVWQEDHHDFGKLLPSHAEAIAYADRMARTNQGEK